MLKSNVKQAKSDIENEILSAIEEIGITGVAELQSNAPVLSGDLKKSITYESEKVGTTYKITFGVPEYIKYAIYTEFRNKTKGWFKNTLRALNPMEILEKHLRRG